MHLYRILILNLSFCLLSNTLFVQAMNNVRERAKKCVDTCGPIFCGAGMLTGIILFGITMRSGKPISNCVSPNNMNVTDFCYDVTIQQCGTCFQNEINSATQHPFYNVSTAQALVQKVDAMIQPVCGKNVQRCIKLASSCNRAKDNNLALFIKYLNQTCATQSTNSFRAGPKLSRFRNMANAARFRHRKKKR